MVLIHHPEAPADLPDPRAHLDRAVSWVSAVGPGILLVAVVAAAATGLGRIAPILGAPVIAVVLGATVAAVHRPPARLRRGIGFSSQRVLQGSVVVLGFGLSLGDVVHSGAHSLPVLVGSLATVLVAAWVLGRVLHLRRDVNILIGVGTAICGASAIAAADGVIEADDADVGYAIATIFTFNVAAVLAYPAIGHALGLSQQSFGLWSGTAINDLSSVVAASTTYGHAAAATGVVVKLTRTLAIVPICIGLGFLRARRSGEGSRVHVRRIVPAFIPAFLVAATCDTLGLVPAGWHHELSLAATGMITAALAAVGLSADLGHIRRAGLRPLGLGAALWVVVGLTSLGLQVVT